MEKDVRFRRLGSGLGAVRFIHQALPELDLDQVDTSTVFLGKKLKAPILISSMTGGNTELPAVNRHLAAAAQAAGIAMGVGSQRAAIEDPALVPTFQVRDIAPDILLFANLGAVQLNCSYGVDECRRAVEMIEADALILHLNPLHEAVQPEGDWNWSNILSRIEVVCRKLPIPVIAKEVGWGLSEQAVRDLSNAGVAALDVAGAGGTSWSEVEYHRARSPLEARIAAAFADWGLTTVESLLLTRETAPHLPAIASGGLVDGVDIAKVIALGASLAGLAGPFLEPATRSALAAVEKATELITVLRIAMFAAGAGNITQLNESRLIQPGC